MYGKTLTGFDPAKPGTVSIPIGQARLDPPLEKSPLGPDHDIVMVMWGEKTTRKEYMFFQEWAESLKNI